MSNQKSIYIIGPVSGAGIEMLGEFPLVQQKLEAAGFQVTTAADDLPVGEDSKNDMVINEYMRKRNENLTQADIVIYLERYDYDRDAVSELKEARRIGKETIMNAKQFLEQYAQLTNVI
jgi:hypothetical protein